jgi:putative transposase
MLCRLLGVSRSGYYAWRRRPPSARARADQGLSRQIREIHEQSRGTYGTPRIWAELHHAGVACSRKRVARLLRQAGLHGCHRRAGPRITRRKPDNTPTAPDLVRRAFTAPAPDRLWVADITYVPTWAGFLYLAVALDVHSRRVVGWAMAEHLRSELVVEAVDMATSRRRPPPGAIHHSDQGSQYASLAFGQRLREAGLLGSMGSRGDCFDNALAESFFATLECELLARQRFPTRNAARLALFEYIEGFYNTHRRHSALGYLSPAAYERRWTISQQVT